ncbi:MAG: 30S ribosomal protein S4 [Bdellovibrionales bacterium]|nr:30S ribosomal protein S4 [Bdellovibrionales bacterium]
MSCVVKSSCKLCRRENLKLYLKGDRCFSDKCAFERRPYPPGQHGQSRLKFSEFALQLREKQKAKRWYGVSEKQFSNNFFKANRSDEMTGVELLKKLELRLDNVIYSLGLANSRRQARQLVLHKHFELNDKIANIPSMIVKKGDVIKVAEKSSSNSFFSNLNTQGKRSVPSWLEVDFEKKSGSVKDLPSRDEVALPVEENMIVEYYSR